MNTEQGTSINEWWREKYNHREHREDTENHREKVKNEQRTSINEGWSFYDGDWTGRSLLIVNWFGFKEELFEDEDAVCEVLFLDVEMGEFKGG